MKFALTMIAVAAVGLSLSSAANAVTKKAPGMTAAPAGMHQPKKASYGKGMRARWGAGCKMSGRC